MTTILKGSCLCGGLRFEASAEPVIQGFCQCLDCRKVSSGRYPAMGFPEQAVKVTGERRTYAKTGDSGKKIYRNFCPTCGGMVFDTGEAFAGITIVNAAMLDDPEQFKPQSVIYARSAISWDHMNPALPKFPTMPPNP